MIAVRVNGAVVDLAQNLPVEIAALDEGPNRIELELVTYGGESLERRTADSVLVFYRPSAVDNWANVLPAVVTLLPPQPNPFNISTRLTFHLPRALNVQLTVYNVQGQAVACLLNERRAAGVHRVDFDGTGLAAGVYICRLEGGSNAVHRKILLLK